MIELTAVNLTNDPLIHGVLMNYRDITVRKRDEEALRASEERFRNVLQDVQLTSPEAEVPIEQYMGQGESVLVVDDIAMNRIRVAE